MTVVSANSITNKSDDSIKLPPVRIQIESVVASRVSSDFTKITSEQKVKIPVKGRFIVPEHLLSDEQYMSYFNTHVANKTFELPITKDNGETLFFSATAVDGVFSTVLYFETAGKYKYTDEEANDELPASTFRVDPIRINIMSYVPE